MTQLMGKADVGRCQPWLTLFKTRYHALACSGSSSRMLRTASFGSSKKGMLMLMIFYYGYDACNFTCATLLLRILLKYQTRLQSRWLWVCNVLVVVPLNPTWTNADR